MPLPKPPVLKATLLSPADYTSAASRTPPIPSPLTAPARLPADLRVVAPASLPPTTPPVQARKAEPANRTEGASPPSPARRSKAIPAASAAAPDKRPKAGKKTAAAPVASKLFVLDTNVLMHDPMSIFRFEEHDVFLPMITLEELDGHKKGMSEVSRNVRQVSRELDALAADGLPDPAQGIPLAKTGHREASGRLFFQTTFMDTRLPEGLPQGKADNQILGVVQALRGQIKDREVVLVSKDINMRIKARALGLPAEDYFNDKTLEDGDLLYTGVLALPADFWEHHG
ncbi:MAG: PIN domain-containing protein, partial [Betaproteobacteria bacterium]